MPLPFVAASAASGSWQRELREDGLKDARKQREPTAPPHLREQPATNNTQGGRASEPAAHEPPARLIDDGLHAPHHQVATTIPMSAPHREPLQSAPSPTASRPDSNHRPAPTRPSPMNDHSRFGQSLLRTPTASPLGHERPTTRCSDSHSRRHPAPPTRGQQLLATHHRSPLDVAELAVWPTTTAMQRDRHHPQQAPKRSRSRHAPHRSPPHSGDPNNRCNHSQLAKTRTNAIPTHPAPTHVDTYSRPTSGSARAAATPNTNGNAANTPAELSACCA